MPDYYPNPVLCSQGGIPYNKEHLDAKDAQIERQASTIDELEAENKSLRAGIERLRDFIYGADVISTQNGILLFEVGPCHPDSAAANTWREVNDPKWPLPTKDTPQFVGIDYGKGESVTAYRCIHCKAVFVPEPPEHHDCEKVCGSPYCQNTFVPTDSAQIYCSDGCKPPGPPDPPVGGPTRKWG